MRGTGYRRARRGNPLPNIFRQWADARGIPCIVIEQVCPRAGSKLQCGMSPDASGLANRTCTCMGSGIPCAAVAVAIAISHTCPLVHALLLGLAATCKAPPVAQHPGGCTGRCRGVGQRLPSARAQTHTPHARTPARACVISFQNRRIPPCCFGRASVCARGACTSHEPFHGFRPRRTWWATAAWTWSSLTRPVCG